MAASGNICAATPCPPPASPPACPIDDSLPFPRRRQTRLVPSSPAALPWSPHCHGHGHGHCHCHCRYHDHYRVHYTPTTRPLHAHHRRHYTRPPPISCSPHASASVRRASLGPVPARPPGDRPQGVCENLFVRLFLPGSASWFEAGGHVHTHYPRRLQNLLCRSLLTDAHALAHALALALARPRPPPWPAGATRMHVVILFSSSLPRRVSSRRLQTLGPRCAVEAASFGPSVALCKLPPAHGLAQTRSSQHALRSPLPWPPPHVRNGNLEPYHYR